MKNKANGWIAVTDKLPEDFGDVLILTTLPRVTIGYYVQTPQRRPGYYDQGWYLTDGRNIDPHVTHWQHLPEPPK